MSPRTALRLLACLCLLVTVFAGAGVASPGSRSVCPVCTEDSAVTIQVHADGNATWYVTEPTGDEMAAADVEDAVEGYHYLDGRVADATTRSENGTTVLRFDVRGFATRFPDGTLLVSYLFVPEEWTYGYHVIEAKRMTVVGPPGTTVTNNPEAGTAAGRRVTITRDDEERSVNAVQDSYIVFAPEGAVTSQAITQVALTYASLFVAGVALGAVPGALLLFVLFGLLRRADGVLAGQYRARQRVWLLGVAVLALVLAGVLTSTEDVIPRYGVPLLVLGYAAGLAGAVLGGPYDRFDRQPSARALALLAVAVGPLAAVGVLVTGGLVGVDTVPLFESLLWVFPAMTALSVGRARERATAVGAALLMLLAYLLVLLVSHPRADSFIVLALVIGLTSIPLYLVGLAVDIDADRVGR